MMNNLIRRLSLSASDFWQALDDLLAWESVADDGILRTTRSILEDVRREGDNALLRYTRRFDRWHPDRAVDLEIPRSRWQEARQNLPQESIAALEYSAERIRLYHERQKLESWSYLDEMGNLLGQQVTPMEIVGLYVPGGKAAYPSSVLMNAIPARVAGVDQVIAVVPTPDGVVNDWVLAAAGIAKVDRIFAIGGAQAIAALSYGTQTVPRVDKIVGPGNIYVATAKSMVFGQVGIDMIAGPSEILIIADEKSNPDWLAMDLFSQAEHDEQAQSILISPSEEVFHKVSTSIERLLPTMERREMIQSSLKGRGIFIQVGNLEEAIKVANYIAPEHLELAIADPQPWLDKIRHAGAIFMGHHTPEALGDYCAGPNHVLPTSRTARFSSPLGVYDFQKRSSLIFCTPQGSRELGKTASLLARGEGLTAHAQSAEFRISG